MCCPQNHVLVGSRSCAAHVAARRHRRSRSAQPHLPTSAAGAFRSRGGGSPGPTDSEYNYEPERTPPNTPTSLASRGPVSPCTRGVRQGIGRFRTGSSTTAKRKRQSESETQPCPTKFPTPTASLSGAGTRQDNRWAGSRGPVGAAGAALRGGGGEAVPARARPPVARPRTLRASRSRAMDRSAVHAAATCPGPASRPADARRPADRQVREDRIRFVSARGKRKEKSWRR